MRRRVPFVPQVESTDCGSAALASVLSYYGRWLTLAEVRTACPVSRDGASALAISNAARSFGLEVDAFKAGFEDLRQLQMPAIIFWTFNHFIVLERITESRVIAVDPAAGRIQMTHDEASRGFSGVVLTFRPGPRFTTSRRSRPSLSRYVEQFRSHAPTVVQIIMISLCLQLLALGLPVGTKLLMDASRLPSYTAWIVMAAAVLGCAILANALFGIARGILLRNLQIAIDQRLTTNLVRHLFALPLDYFLRRRSGDVLQRINSTEAIRAVLTAAFTSSLLDVLTLIGYVSFGAYLSPILGAVILGVVVAKGIALWWSRLRTQELVTAEGLADGSETTSFVEMFSALETIRATGSEQYVMARWHRNAVTRVNASTRRRRYEGYEQVVRDLLTAVGVIAILLIGAPLAQAGALTIGSLAAVLVIYGLVHAPLDSVMNALGQFQHLDRHLTWIEDVSESAPEKSGTKTLGDAPLHIELEDVSFRYTAAGPDVLSRISMRIAAGQHVALVGPTGAGKSTLARMLVGLLQPADGVIRFAGCDLRDLDFRWLRSRIAIVLQDVALLDDDVLTNLRLYRPTASLAEVRQAAAMASVDDVIERLDGGYLNVLAKNGSTLSGGERQRLAIARALLAQPSILVLDEATSALDRETEMRVFGHLSNPGFTRISVAHRLETVRGADYIYVLDRGAVVQAGTYDQLMEQDDGIFRTLAFHGV